MGQPGTVGDRRDENVSGVSKMGGVSGPEMKKTRLWWSKHAHRG